MSGNLLFYFVEGDPQSVVTPDVFLVRGVPKDRRRTYKLWEEGKVPSLIIELTSDSTQDEDLSEKKQIYERLGVEEYFLHDPWGDYLNPRLQGYRLTQGRYEPLSPASDGSLLSRVTGLTLREEEPKLRLIDTASGQPLLWNDELTDRILAAEKRAERDIAARHAAEEELTRLRRELEARKRD